MKHQSTSSAVTQNRIKRKKSNATMLSSADASEPASSLASLTISSGPTPATADSFVPVATTWDPVAHMLEQDKELLLSVPLNNLCDEDARSAHHTMNSTTGGVKDQLNGGQYWMPTYNSSQSNTPVIVQPPSLDTVNKKNTSSAATLFTTTYNLTSSGSKRVNIAIDVHHVWGIQAIMEIENISKSVKVPISEFDWAGICHAERYINQQMTTEYDPTHPPPEIRLADVTLSITTVYDDCALCIKSGVDSVYLRHPSVIKLFNLDSSIRFALERLNRWVPSIEAAYSDVKNSLRVEVVVREARDVLALEEDYVRLQGGYVRLLWRVGRAVCRLLAGDARAADVASDVLGAWLRAEDATRRDMARMRLFSRSARGITVSLLVKRADQTAARVSVALPDTKPHKRCSKRVASLHEQVRALCPRLQQSSRTLQYLLYLTRALPLLRDFHDRLHGLQVLDQPDQEPAPDGADSLSALYCGGPLWTRLTAEVCHHRCRPQRLAQLLLNLDQQLDRELGLRLAGATEAGLEARGTKREASPTKNPLIGMLEDEDDLQPIKIPQLDPSLFKPLPD
ncbi:uncharacterized protein LOC126252149 [Schistocerca nitens]|uniref:uncharacterized protein LOC126252149 n=1 Tax=Schistocerca nitens TaxID=7011 RepID=UPI002118C879|nr:uncharacterized protein LOC126252149 [Schistocerca nitens]